MFRLFLLICVVSSQGLFADISDHFKKPLKHGPLFHNKNNVNKSRRHSIRNVDFIYLINLDQRPEKFAHCLNELKPYGIRPFRFSAVNGWELSLEAINDVGVKYIPSKMQGGKMATTYLINGDGTPHHENVSVPGRSYFVHCMAKGTIGIVLSHLSVLQDAYDSGYQTIWVMEDDIQVIRNPHVISKLITKLDALVGKKGWDVLFTDYDIKNGEGQYVPCSGYAWRPNFLPVNPEKYSRKEKVSADFRMVGARFGAHSMIVRRSGMKKILDFIKRYRIYLPYDMDYYLPFDINMYTVLDDVVSNLPKALSDNGVPGYKNKK